VIHDKHARAFEVLRGPRAEQMAKNLAATNKDREPIAAHEDARCLACHTIPQAAGAAFTGEVEVRASGVGCESCHGPAAGPKPWLAAHTTAGWKSLKADEKRSYGMTDLANLEVQTRVCAGCHVGAPEDNGIPRRDCNHDIMAAGHPRLAFEFAVFRLNLPPHWRPEKHPKSDEARAWAAGQVVSAEASVDLLLDRARGAEKNARPWPEFAEHDCYACHANLREPSWRSDPSYRGKRAPGTLPYAVWYWALLPDVTPGARDDALAKHFEELAETMSRPEPDPKKVTDQADAIKKALKERLQAVNGAAYDAKGAKAVLAALARRKDRVKGMSWDEVQQLALAVGALQPATGEKALLEPLGELYRSLAFPPGFESPATFRRDNTLDKQLDALFKLLP
jgi:hypothetical protein